MVFHHAPTFGRDRVTTTTYKTGEKYILCTDDFKDLKCSFMLNINLQKILSKFKEISDHFIMFGLAQFFGCDHRKAYNCDIFAFKSWLPHFYFPGKLFLHFLHQIYEEYSAEFGNPRFLPNLLLCIVRSQKKTKKYKKIWAN